MEKMTKQSYGKLADHFFAHFQPGFNSETLKIPPGFLKEGVNQVILRSYCRRSEEEHQDCWDVEIYEFSKDRVYFYKGWEKFVEDHHLLEGDLVLFEYDGGMCFSVRIFEKNGLEKVYNLNVDDQTNNHHQGEETSFKGTKNQHIIKEQGGVSKKSNSSSDDDDHSCPGRTTPAGGSRKDYEIVQSKTKSFSSRNPFFWRLLKDYNVTNSYMLSIPKLMSKNIFTEETKEVILKNKQGRAWEVMVRTSNGQYYFVPSGWKSYVLDNSLKAEDVCIFELVGEAVLQVHVF